MRFHRLCSLRSWWCAACTCQLPRRAGGTPASRSGPGPPRRPGVRVDSARAWDRFLRLDRRFPPLARHRGDLPAASRRRQTFLGPTQCSRPGCASGGADPGKAHGARGGSVLHASLRSTATCRYCRRAPRSRPTALGGWSTVAGGWARVDHREPLRASPPSGPDLAPDATARYAPAWTRCCRGRTPDSVYDPSCSSARAPRPRWSGGSTVTARAFLPLLPGWCWWIARSGALVLDLRRDARGPEREVLHKDNDAPAEPARPRPRTCGRAGRPGQLHRRRGPGLRFPGLNYEFYCAWHDRDSHRRAGLPLRGHHRFLPSELRCPYPNALWSGSPMIFGEGFCPGPGRGGPTS
jgi:hypothetical protein